jgi:predicted deacetylase
MEKEHKKSSRLVLHGLKHEGNPTKLLHFLFPNFSFALEFRNLNYKQAKQKILTGLNEYKKVFESNPSGFIPPSWMISKESKHCLRDIGFKYTTTWNRIIDLQKNKKIFSIVNGFDRFGENKLSPFVSRTVSNLHIKLQVFFGAKIIRFSIHPGDIIDHNFPLEFPMLKEIIKKGYKPITYEKVLDNL